MAMYWRQLDAVKGQVAAMAALHARLNPEEGWLWVARSALWCLPPPPAHHSWSRHVFPMEATTRGAVSSMAKARERSSLPAWSGGWGDGQAQLPRLSPTSSPGKRSHRGFLLWLGRKVWWRQDSGQHAAHRPDGSHLRSFNTSTCMELVEARMMELVEASGAVV